MVVERAFYDEAISSCLAAVCRLPLMGSQIDPGRIINSMVFRQGSLKVLISLFCAVCPLLFMSGSNTAGFKAVSQNYGSSNDTCWQGRSITPC